jgi:hypothetical protein
MKEENNSLRNKTNLPFQLNCCFHFSSLSLFRFVHEPETLTALEDHTRAGNAFSHIGLSSDARNAHIGDVGSDWDTTQAAQTVLLFV